MIRYWKQIRYYFLSTYFNAFDFVDLLFNIKKYRVSLEKIPEQCIIFVTDKYSPRVEKLAFALNSIKKFNIILITKSRKIDFSGSYIRHFSVRTAKKTIWLVQKLNPKIIHVFSCWNFDIASGLIKNKHTFSGKIIFDDYDVLAGMLNDRPIKLYYEQQLQNEKFCLENADGICCRSLETQYAKRILKYRINAKRIFFPEYMWEKPVMNESIFTKKLVYIGNYSNAITDLAEKIAPIGWTLEVYAGHHAIKSVPNPPSNLILHRTQSPLELVKTLRRFRVAIQLPGIILDSVNSIYTSQKYRYAAAGKIFDYFEAGLIVLIADEVFQRWLLRRYYSAIEIDSNFPLEDIVRKLSNFELPNSGTEISVNHLTLKEQAHRLEKFYNSVITES